MTDEQPDQAGPGERRHSQEYARAPVDIRATANEVTKFEADHLAQFGYRTDVDVLITDTAPDAHLVAEVESAGPTEVQA